MESIAVASTVLAAMELVPGDPSDLTAVLLDPRSRHELLAAGSGSAPTDPLASAPDERLALLTRYLIEHLDQRRVEAWKEQLEEPARQGWLRPVVAGAKDYPTRLLDVWLAPPLLFRRSPRSTQAQCCGESVAVDEAGTPAIAIVGGRDAASESLDAAFAIAAAVAESGARVVSGLAAGVDTAAHLGALDAGGVTTAVMGTGVHHVFPRENFKLAEQIAARGVLVSQFAPDAPRTRTTFLRRNHVIAGLSDTSLVIDAAERSGSRHEIEQALLHGRSVLMWEPAMSREAWAVRLVREGKAAFVDSASDVVDHLR
jgi:DNA processing protein